MKPPRFKPQWYVLDDEHRPVKASGLQAWARWFAKNQERRIVEQTDIANGLALVSTVFLGLDHNHFGKGLPIVFETMVFGLDPEDSGSMMHRYSSWDDAVAGHKATVKNVKALVAKAVVKSEIKEQH